MQSDDMSVSFNSWEIGTNCIYHTTLGFNVWWYDDDDDDDNVVDDDDDDDNVVVDDQLNADGNVSE